MKFKLFSSFHNLLVIKIFNYHLQAVNKFSRIMFALADFNSDTKLKTGFQKNCGRMFQKYTLYFLNMHKTRTLFVYFFNANTNIAQNRL